MKSIPKTLDERSDLAQMRGERKTILDRMAVLVEEAEAAAARGRMDVWSEHRRELVRCADELGRVLRSLAQAENAEAAKSPNFPSRTQSGWIAR